MPPCISRSGGRLVRSWNRFRYTATATIRLVGDRVKLHCNLCGTYGSFAPFGDPPRRGAMCPSCGSLERHRLLWLWASSAQVLTSGRVLHFAPERAIEKHLRASSVEYATADLMKEGTDMRLDLEEIDQASDSWDCVLAGHVLEHVDDRKALAEIYRILRPGGTAVLTIPVIEGWPETYSNPDATTAALRRRYHGQSDHLRYYGRDIRQRITGAGFALEEFVAVEPAVSQLGLLRGEVIFIARKP